MRRLLLATTLLLAARGAAAQDEAALRSYFQGKQVMVKVDMPATHKGIDLRFDREQPFDIAEQSSRLRDYDAAIREGQRVAVTQVKVKDDLVEFQLAGGGFNWSSDTTTQSFSATPKSSRESDLERRIKTETDEKRKRDLQRELDGLRRDRQREDDYRRRDVEAHNERARERDRERALKAGSRFNVRFKKKLPPDALTPQGLSKYLEPWVDFSGDWPSGRANGGGGGGGLRKGQLREEVERLLGSPRRESACRGGDADLECVTAVYRTRDEEIEATFVEDVLVRFSPRRR
jgi:hypothetical protein